MAEELRQTPLGELPGKKYAETTVEKNMKASAAETNLWPDSVGYPY
jgi:hypothetical protein